MRDGNAGVRENVHCALLVSHDVDHIRRRHVDIDTKSSKVGPPCREGLQFGVDGRHDKDDVVLTRVIQQGRNILRMGTGRCCEVLIGQSASSAQFGMQIAGVKLKLHSHTFCRTAEAFDKSSAPTGRRDQHLDGQPGHAVGSFASVIL